MTFQVAGGTPRPAYPVRFPVTDIEGEGDRIVRDAGPSYATAIKQFAGPVTVCDFLDPWGNAFGLSQVLFAEGAAEADGLELRAHDRSRERDRRRGRARIGDGQQMQTAGSMTNNGMQLTAPRASADAARCADKE